MASQEEGASGARGDALADLTLALQAAMRVLDVQTNYLEAITGLVRADAYGFAHVDALGERLVPISTLTREAPEGLVMSYDDFGADHDPVLHAARAANAPVDNTRVLSPEQWRDHSLSGVLGRHGLRQTLVVPLVGDNAQLLGTLYFARGVDERPFSAVDIDAMTIAKRHIETALRRANLYDSLDRHASVLGWAFNQLDVPTVLSAGAEQVAIENAAVRRLLRAHREAGAPLARLIADNADRLRSGRDRVVAQSTVLPPSGPVGTPSARLTVKSTALRRGSDAIISFIFLRRSDLEVPVEHAPLTAREREVVAWVAEGLTNREIADLAYVSENTVRQHLKRIFTKLNVHSRAEMVQAIWQGGEDVEPPGLS
jgi:DNA-binding CsgD family transcriptional regulator/GAF domain-containing protein